MELTRRIFDILDARPFPVMGGRSLSLEKCRKRPRPSVPGASLPGAS